MARPCRYGWAIVALLTGVAVSGPEAGKVEDTVQVLTPEPLQDIAEPPPAALPPGGRCRPVRKKGVMNQPRSTRGVMLGVVLLALALGGCQTAEPKAPPAKDTVAQASVTRGDESGATQTSGVQLCRFG
jgi:hypothetical protein